MDETCSEVPASKKNLATPCDKAPQQAAAAAESSYVNLFPWKLHEMLTTQRSNLQGRYDAIVSWQPHGRALRVHNKEAFAQLVMPRFFNQTKYKSFQRQLHLWGFKRINHGEDVGAYYHMYFLRGQPDLCKYMRRHRAKGGVDSKEVHCAGDPPDDEKQRDEQATAPSPASFLLAPPTVPRVQRTFNENRYGMNLLPLDMSEHNSSVQQSALLNRFLLRGGGVQAANTRATGSAHLGNFFVGGIPESLATNPPFLTALSSLHEANTGTARMPPPPSSSSDARNAAVQRTTSTSGHDDVVEIIPASTSSHSSEASCIAYQEDTRSPVGSIVVAFCCFTIYFTK
jgi:hypothetical protein